MSVKNTALASVKGLEEAAWACAQAGGGVLDDGVGASPLGREEGGGTSVARRVGRPEGTRAVHAGSPWGSASLCACGSERLSTTERFSIRHQL